MTLTEIKSIKSKADIVTVISKTINLSRNGANYIASCPFHNERSKSFTVSKSKGIFKCFGCGKSGDVIDYVMLKNGLPYQGAIKWIEDSENLTADKDFKFEELPEPETSFLDDKIIYKTLGKHNNFIKWLTCLFPDFKQSDYFIGTSKHWPGSVIFWYVDYDYKVRSGKIMQYNPVTGKRVKEPKPLITWVHKVLKLKDFNMSICLFGEHLLRIHQNKKVCIVESEKTAIVASLRYPKYLWLASGSLTNLTYKRTSCLINRDITLYPDVGAEDRWREKMEQLSELIPGKWQIKCLESNVKGYDLCDFIIDNLNI